MVKFVFIFLIMKCGVGNGRLIHKKINMSTQRAGGIYEDWDFHNQWMEYDTFEEGGGSSVASDLSQNDRAVHVDFFNDFDDIFDDENLD